MTSTAGEAWAGVGHVAAFSGTDERRRAIPSRSGPHSESGVEMRLAQLTEGDVLRRLAELDSSPELTGQVVIALIDGEAVAGLSLVDHRVVANPFVPTRDAIALLRLRAQQLAGGPTRRRGRTRLGLRR